MIFRIKLYIYKYQYTFIYSKIFSDMFISSCWKNSKLFMLRRREKRHWKWLKRVKLQFVISWE